MRDLLLKLLEGPPRVFSALLLCDRYRWIPSEAALQMWLDWLLAEVRAVLEAHGGGV